MLANQASDIAPSKTGFKKQAATQSVASRCKDMRAHLDVIVHVEGIDTHREGQPRWKEAEVPGVAIEKSDSRAVPLRCCCHGRLECKGAGAERTHLLAAN